MARTRFRNRGRGRGSGRVRTALPTGMRTSLGPSPAKATARVKG